MRDGEGVAGRVGREADRCAEQPPTLLKYGCGQKILQNCRLLPVIDNVFGLPVMITLLFAHAGQSLLHGFDRLSDLRKYNVTGSFER